jgi:hypothetical protein
MFRVPPSMVGDVTKLSNNNAIQQNLSFVVDTLRPYLCRFEQEIIRKLLPDTGRNSGKYYVQFDVRERLRGDFKTEAEGFSLGKQWGFLTTNMILEELGENPIGPEGDILWAPVNMTNAKNLLPGTDLPAAVPPKPIEPDEGLDSERNLMGRYSVAYIQLFRDGIGRLCNRDKRDEAAITAILQPCLESLSAHIIDSIKANSNELDAWQPPADKLIRDHIKGIEKRTADWTADKADEATGVELQKAVRALYVDLSRDAAGFVALGRLGSIS